MYFSEQYFKSQDSHFLQLHGSKASLLLPLEITGNESLSQPYSYELKCLCKADNDTLLALHGQMLSCEIGAKNKSFPSRFIHGVITRITYSDDNSEQRTCIIILQPEIAALSSGKRTRIWSEITVPDIVSTIFKEHLFYTPYIRLCNSPLLMEYKIQYQESDLDFINRILSDTGVCYFFIHHKDSHIMVIADDPVSHPDASFKTLQYLPRGNVLLPGYIQEWTATKSLKCSGVTLTGYNANNTSEISIKSESSVTKVNASNCIYEDIIPEGHREHIQRHSKAIIASCDSQIQHWHGETSSWWLACGERFTLIEHKNKKEEYRITSLQIRAVNNYTGTTGYFTCELYAADNKTSLTFKPKASKPFISGVLLARVVGPESEEIFTDTYGRVKIRFLWGEEAIAGTEKTSCWVRVSQPWSGDGFGSQFIPRVGSEVLVSFIQGNPDHPIIIGSVYNGQNKPLFTLSDNNKTGFITRSVKNGKKRDGHQLVFDDSNGKEKTILSSSGDYYLKVKKDMISDINGSLLSTFAKGRKSEIKKGNDTLLIEQGDLQNEVTGNIDIKVCRGNYNLKVTGGSGNLSTDKNLTLESTQSIKLKVGTSEITLSPTGINIKGVLITIEGQATTEVKGITLKLEGQAVTEVKGTILTFQGSAMTQIKGGLVNIG